MWKERVVLEDEPDAAPLRRHLDAPIEPRLGPERDEPARRPDETGDRAQHGRLPGSRGPDERERLRPDLER